MFAALNQTLECDCNLFQNVSLGTQWGQYSSWGRIYCVKMKYMTAELRPSDNQKVGSKKKQHMRCSFSFISCVMCSWGGETCTWAQNYILHIIRGWSGKTPCANSQSKGGDTLASTYNPAMTGWVTRHLMTFCPLTGLNLQNQGLWWHLWVDPVQAGQCPAPTDGSWRPPARHPG